MSCSFQSSTAYWFPPLTSAMFLYAPETEASFSTCAGLRYLPNDFVSCVLKILHNSKGRPQLVHNNYLFRVHQYRRGKVHWQCVRNDICRARIHTRGNELIVRCAKHTHGPHTEKIRQRVGGLSTGRSDVLGDWV
ncbi:hypothetical protein PR048_022856 [Dryococelus australis]|uniref:FLYWCH-type domain-containing protein n=1 Tax=Dryococelus australis TaxID=614101 RepID=A0ABQ9GSE2_9NEOP|nr:hypothetical protein PR048_022856 [Dryococelus australis]